ncbi:MAG: gamma-glutamyl-gamma-aminobutyrate hydrolase family protein [Alphaproteobacteria bacterium]
MNTIYLEYKKEYDSYIIADEVINDFIKKNIVPNIRIKQETLPNSPTIGVLMGREKDCYATHNEYVKTTLDAGANIKFLDYTNCLAQLEECDGLLLIGGAFPTPKQYYNSNQSGFGFEYTQRLCAYIALSINAQTKKIPILAICAGAQIIAMEKGLKIDLVDNHQTKELNVHKIKIASNSLLKKIINKEEITVNSRHKEQVINNNTINIYATSDDNVLEAWGDENNNILCVQWHPETMYVENNDKEQLEIYKWLINKAKELK